MEGGKIVSNPNAVPSAAQPSPATKKRRRWPWVLLGIFVLILLFIVLLPTIASTGPVTSIVLGEVNKQINGAVSIDSCSFGWFSGFKINGIRVADAQGNSVAEVKSIALPAAVPALLSSQKQLGAVSIESPAANIVLYKDGTNSLTRLLKAAPSPTPRLPAGPSQPLGFDLAGDIAVTNGAVSIQPAGAAEPFLVRDLNVSVKIASLEKPILLEAKASLGAERAPLVVNGSATVLHEGKLDPAAVEADIAVTLGGLEIGPIAALARGYGSPVEAGGALTVQKLTAQVRGIGSIHAAGDIEIKPLTLFGGPLGKDQPKFDHVGLAFDASKTGQTINIANFSFDSPVATASASGSVEMPSGRPLEGTLAANARVNLPALAAQLPDTLRLRRGLTIESGVVKLDAKLESDERGPRVNASLRVEDVAAVNEGRRIALEEPIALDLAASQTDEGPRLEDLRLTSSFASVTGAGSMEKFDLAVTSDLAAALREAAKFVDLAGKSCAGQASVALHLAGADRQKTIAADATLTGLMLSGFTPGPVNLPEAKVALNATALLDERNAPQSVNGLKVDLTAPFASGEITAESITLAPGQPLATLQNGKIALNADLGDAARFASDAGLMPAGIGLSGKLDFGAALTAEDGILHLAPNLTLTDLDAADGGKHLREPKVTLAGSIEAAPASRTAKIRDMKCDFSAGSFAVASLDVPDWAQAPTGVTATITGDADVERALAALKDFAALPQGMSVAGQAKLALKALAAAGKLAVNLEASVSSLKITPASGPAIEDPKVSLAAAADLLPASQTATFNSLAIKSSFYSLDAKGSLSDWGKARTLTLDGTQECDWDKIGPLVVAFSGKEIAMSGKSSSPLHISDLSLGARGLRALLSTAIAEAAIQIPQIKYLGLNVAQLDVPAKIKDSVATLDVTGQVNSGALKLPGKLDASQATPEFTLPPNTAILAGAQLTPAMADEAISKAIPLFKGCTSTEGSISLDSKNLDVPLGADALQKAAFEGSLSFKGVQMSATGQLQSILSVLSLGGAGGATLAQIPDQSVSLSLRNGRIYQGPMQVSVAGISMTISGSVGMADKTLDMAVEIPITLEMVGGRTDVYEALKGQVLRVAITGTTDQPEYSVKNSLEKLAQAAAKNLLEQKAKEEGTGLIKQGLQNLFR
jgi:hypothetical protein